MLVKLTACLNNGQYHLVKALATYCKVTPNIIQQAIQHLIAHGVAIEVNPIKGYRLIEPLILLKKDLLINAFKQVDCQLFTTIGSTNQYLKDNASISKIQLCVAEQQTQGKGQFGRTWHSPFGQNLYFSSSYPFTLAVNSLAGLSLIVGLVLIETLTQLGFKQLQLKWPNDLRHQGKKLGGILTELNPLSQGIRTAIIGIGLNVNMLADSATASINQAWTSLRQLTNCYHDRNKLLIALVKRLLKYLEQFNKQGLAPFISQWQAVDALWQQPITLTCGQTVWQGIAQGINAQGHLLVALSSGEMRTFVSGEVTLQCDNLKNI